MCAFFSPLFFKFTQKFENETHSPTEQTAVVPNTAYPIFRALNTSSPEISRVQPAVIVAQTPTNVRKPFLSIFSQLSSYIIKCI